jgi:hypothetical protein
MSDSENKEPQDNKTGEDSGPASKGGAQAKKNVFSTLSAVVERTKLDLDACREVAARLMADNESKAQDERAFKSAPDDIQIKKPIDKYKVSSPCDSDWDALVGTNRCRFCSACGLNVFDASDMNEEELKQAIFQKENKEAVTLYKRKDKRFMTSDCPVGQKRVRAGLITISSIAAVLLGAVGIAAWIMITRPPEPVEPPATQATGSGGHAPRPQTASRTGSALGTAPWLQNNRLPAEPAAANNIKEIARRMAQMGNSPTTVLSPLTRGVQSHVAIPKAWQTVPLTQPATAPNPVSGGPSGGTGAEQSGAAEPTQAQSSQSTESSHPYIQYYGSKSR